MPRLSVVLFILFNLFCCLSFSQGKPLPKNDSSSLNVRNFDTQALANYKKDKNFNYGGETKDFAPSLWDQFWTWFWDLFKSSVSNATSDGIFKYIFLILGSGALIFIIVKLLGMDFSVLFTGKSKQLTLEYNESLENIHEIKFDEEINKAVQNHDLRLAVRLLYLKLLKGLTDSGKIHWQPDKTNSAYINELKNPAQKEKFKQLTRRFEYVWYGSFPVDADTYKKISGSFGEFNPKAG